MIPDNQILEIIIRQYPSLQPVDKSKTLKALESVADYAKTLLDKEAYGEFKRFIEFINQLYYHCNKRFKLGIDNILLYKISDRIDMCPVPHSIRAMLPQRMRDMLCKQFGASAI